MGQLLDSADRSIALLAGRDQEMPVERAIGMVAFRMGMALGYLDALIALRPEAAEQFAERAQQMVARLQALDQPDEVRRPTPVGVPKDEVHGVTS